MKSQSLHIIDLCASNMKTEGTHTIAEKLNASVLNYWDITFKSNQDLVGTDSFEDGAGRSGWESTMDEREGECLLLWPPPPHVTLTVPLRLWTYSLSPGINSYDSRLAVYCHAITPAHSFFTQQRS